MNKNKKGFTLIELLVVIAIIGLLSSVVLAALSSVRVKGKDSSLRSEMVALRNAAELYYHNNGSSYLSLFTLNNTWASANPNTQNILTAINNVVTSHTSGSSVLAWAAQAQLPSTVGGTALYVCVDSLGSGKTGTALLTAGITVCP